MCALGHPAHIPVSLTSAELPETSSSSMLPPSACMNGRTRSSTASTRSLVTMSPSGKLKTQNLEPLEPRNQKPQSQRSCQLSDAEYPPNRRVIAGTDRKRGGFFADRGKTPCVRTRRRKVVPA